MFLTTNAHLRAPARRPARGTAAWSPLGLAVSRDKGAPPHTGTQEPASGAAAVLIFRDALDVGGPQARPGFLCARWPLQDRWDTRLRARLRPASA